MRIQRTLLLLVALASFSFPQENKLPRAAERLTAQNALFDEQYESDLRDFPERATSFGDYRYNDKLADHSLAAILERQKRNESFLAGLKAGLDQFQARLSHQSEAISDWLNLQRRSLAEARLQAWLGLGVLQFLGQGAEGVVFTDGIKCYKFIDAWKVRERRAKQDFLKGLVNRWGDTKTLYPIEALHEAADSVVLVYQYEPSQPYVGGHGPDFIRMLRMVCHSFDDVFCPIHKRLPSGSSIRNSVIP